jgi:putative transposase
MNLRYRACYQRNLPHIQPEGAELFSTFRLANTLPRPLLDQWKEDKKRLVAAVERSRDPVERSRRQAALNRAWFSRMDHCLDRAQNGPLWLREPRVAQMVANALHHLDGKKYDLIAYSIMPNHVHSTFIPLFTAPLGRASLPDRTTEHEKAPARGRNAGESCHSLASIMHSLKGYTASRCNRLLGRTGPFWEHESFDHWVRDEAEESRIVEYILNNPVKAGLAKSWQDWPWNFWRGAT